ncbi:MAG: ribonuclease [Verrucomicrobiaceae bacterium]|nr:ribonuclease [Verrucomicrobiaceae bacterium]
MSNAASIIHVTEQAHLADLAMQWQDAPLLALDTEFLRETTFYPIAGLIQLSDARHQYLIDPLTINDWAPLQRAFNGAVPKVLHACSEDLEIFAQLIGVPPQPLFDTQIGAALAGFGFSLGYQALLKTCLDIDVEKEQTRSDWLRRPLSAEQCHYAALDVAYLPEVFALISARLHELGRFAWWQEEGQRTLAASREQITPQNYYQKLSGAWRLNGTQIAALQQLCAWREIEARARNVPRGRIVKDPQLIEIAKALPRSLSELSASGELHPQQTRADGAKLLEIIEAARAIPAADWPASLPAPLPRESGSRLKRMRELIETRALELNISPEILARKRDCEMLLRSGELSPALQGWRKSIIGEPLLALHKTLG